METSDSEIESGEPRISKKKKADLDPFTEVEFLDLSNLSGTGFEDVSESDLLAISANENSFPPTQQKENSGSLLNMTVSVPIGHFKNKQFHFVGVFYIRLFRSQHLTDPILHKDVYGNCIRSVMTCIWEASKNSIAREIKVVYNDNEQLLRWSTKECPDETDLDKFVLLKHEKNKKFYSMEDIRDNAKLLTHWRGKRIQVHVFKYSHSIATLSMWEKVNKELLHPERKDKTGAPATEEVFGYVQQLKEIHSHYTALFSSWERWANFILSQPADRRQRLMKEAPPDEYLHLFRAAPVSEANLLSNTRYGLHVANNITDSISTAVNNLCIKVDSIVDSVNQIQKEMHCLKTRVDTSRSMLDAMQESLPPEETQFSVKLASLVTDMPDIDHND